MTTPVYEELLLETLPRRIESEEQYEAIQGRFGVLLVKHAGDYVLDSEQPWKL